MTDTPLLQLDSIAKQFVSHMDFAARLVRGLGAKVGDEVVRAVDHVSLQVEEGEVLGLVGESGCGKSTLGRIVAGIIEPSAGRVIYQGQDIGTLSPAEWKRIMLGVQMIFQDPMSSLNPRLKVAEIVGEAPLVHGMVSRSELGGYVDDILARVGLEPSYKSRYPHQFSGGQRQRIGIARALAVNPNFIVCDEAVAALDVSIQAQTLNLFMKLRDELQLAYLFISHDLGVVEHISDRVCIMYLGRIIEQAPTEEIYSRPNHHYTQALMREIPRLEVRETTYHPIAGEIPSPLHPPAGCHFHPRCLHVMPRCHEEVPILKEIAPKHFSACHLND